MYIRCHDNRSINTNAFLRAGVCLVWAAGMSLGFVTARFYKDLFCAFVRSAPSCLPAFIGSLAVNVLPFIISACAVFFFQPFIYPILLFRGFLLGSGLAAIAYCFFDAGFMMSGLLFFNEICFAPFWLWYAFRVQRRKNASVKKEVQICLAAGLLLSVLDVYAVAGFLLEVINF